MGRSLQQQLGLYRLDVMLEILAQEFNLVKGNNVLQLVGDILNGGDDIRTACNEAEQHEGQAEQNMFFHRRLL